MNARSKIQPSVMVLLLAGMSILPSTVSANTNLNVTRADPTAANLNCPSEALLTVRFEISNDSSGGEKTVRLSGTYALEYTNLILAPASATPPSGTFTDLASTKASPAGAPMGLAWTFQLPRGPATGTIKLTASTTNLPSNLTDSKSYNVTVLSPPDSTPPTVTGVLSPLPVGIWNNTDVVITWSATDPESGIASGPTPASHTVTTEGLGQVFTATATNRVGLTGTGSITVNLDKTAPTTTATPSGTAGNGPWWTSDVLVTLSAVDSISGPASTEYGPGTAWSAYAGPFTIDVEGTTTVYYRSTDNAGNTEDPARTLVISIDKSAPSLTLSPDGTKENDPWFTSGVTMTLVGQDAGSGFDHAEYQLDGAASVVYGEPFAIAGDGVHSLSCKAFDKAGNEYDLADQTIRIDGTPPNLSCSAATADGNPYTAGTWTNQDVTVTFAADDPSPGSGLAQVTAPATVSAEGKGQSVTGTASDVAGNTATLKFEGIQIDKTGPATTASLTGTQSGVEGWKDWYVQVPVQVALRATDEPADSASGVKEIHYRWQGPEYTCASESTVALSDQGQNTLEYWAVDNAGNEEPPKQATIRIDSQGPVVTLPDLPACMLNEVVNVTWTAADPTPGSGLATAASGTLSLDTGSVGGQTLSLAAGFAKDNCGNESAPVSQEYSVRYCFGGFRPPINANGSSIFKLGSTVPVKFQLLDALGNPAPMATTMPTIKVAKVSSGVTGSYLEATSTAAATDGNAFRYDPTAQQYIFNLATKPLSTGTWMIGVTLPDGSGDQAYAVRMSLK